ncbi:hypothetical protein [Streptomyces sp. NPDC056105]|uniref:hypothetical protein n=1 Tax=Streptomyces sp. NPDC056105 TaxID=3345714 RepID=UPI0035DC50BD
MISNGYRCPLDDGDADDTSEPLPGAINSKIIPDRSANVTTPSLSLVRAEVRHAPVVPGLPGPLAAFKDPVFLGA